MFFGNFGILKRGGMPLRTGVQGLRFTGKPFAWLGFRVDGLAVVVLYDSLSHPKPLNFRPPNP